MRIPLDYYQILSVPVKATSSQLEQAYSDRIRQQPRREYNDQAIQSRQELIKHAYQVLADPKQRANYDAQFLVNMQPVEFSIPEAIVSEENEESRESATESLIQEDLPLDVRVINPTIEVAPSQLIGALLILHELGEYELALRLGVDYFNSQDFDKLSSEQEVKVRTDAQENIILSLTLAYLELGREQWHRREYENAAVSGQMGVDLLNRENLFPQIKAELELDLYKLRPYRVLELISQNQANSPERAKGFELLREMLLQRQGIEGKGQDRSGLNFDQFLCFIQQLRTYLTSTEQQQLFDREAQNDSAIASYLAVYALLARGFCFKQPELVLRAQRKLDYLSEKQDVAWEQTVSALLLGHTEKAIYKLQNSPDKTKLEQVQRHSLDTTDLLPGICFYSEQWLQEDVIAQFSDLANISLTIREYFADQEVQAYLEELAPPALLSKMPNASFNSHQQDTANNQKNKSVNNVGFFSRWRNLLAFEKTSTTASNKVSQPERELITVTVGTSTTSAPQNNHAASKTNSKPRFRQTVPQNSTQVNYSPPATAKSPSLPLQHQQRAVPPEVIQKAQGKARQKRIARKKKLSSATVRKGRLFILGLILGTGTLAFVAMKLFLNPAKNANQASLATAISQPMVELPDVKPKVAVKPLVSFTEQSQQVIQTWLTSKSAAFGKEHKIDQLNNILAEPLLATWRKRALYYQKSNSYREYEHNITVRSAKIDPNNPQKATVDAEVKEIAKHYQAGKLDNAQSYDDNLLVRYQLIFQGENWLIQNTEVLKTL
ncbi:IMS domain-containing protein [Pleurocapsa sp. FMAR1]|uniref:IMS domain-containing protein n=1 Tax=Pleurocapsa sp. FMAR1 TaxID=3040204 RepID=UPI0029C8C2E2|nr:IMS domain-containing protein [Pleurocapsa sp. FMAR1]